MEVDLMALQENVLKNDAQKISATQRDITLSLVSRSLSPNSVYLARSPARVHANFAPIIDKNYGVCKTSDTHEHCSTYFIYLYYNYSDRKEKIWKILIILIYLL